MEKNCFEEIVGTKVGNLYTCGKGTDGYCYKDINAFKDKCGICYIAECEFFDSDTIEVSNDKIENGGISTYESIIKDTMNVCNRYGINNVEFIDYIAKFAFDMVDWECVETYLNGIDIDCEWEDWCKMKNR